MLTLSQLDRRLGAAIRRAIEAVPHGARVSTLVAATMSPAFRVAVALMVADRAHRRSGLESLGAAVGAAITARLLRDRLGRRRPGSREEGGFPSRHAAAATAIAATVSRRHRRLGRSLTIAAALGMAARIATAEHDPADIAAGAALGLAASQTTTSLSTRL